MHRMPVFHDDQSFRDQTDRMFREMQEKMSFHSINDPSWSMPSTRWSSTYNPTFFELWPTTSPATGQSHVGHQAHDIDAKQFEVLDDDTMRSLFVDLDQGQGRGGEGRLFRMSFDMRQYDPADISVRSENDCLVVEAKHEDDKGAASSSQGSKVVRQFCRRIQLPPGVDPTKLTSTLSADNILTVQAPVPPDYNAVMGNTGTATPQQLNHARSSTIPSSSLQQSTIQPQLRHDLQAPLNTGLTTGRVSPFQQQNHQQVTASTIPLSSRQPSTLHQQMQQPIQLQAPVIGIASGGRISPRLGSVAVQSSASPTVDVPTFTVDSATGRRRMDLAVELGPPYTADDIAVRLEGRRLTVDARHENRDQSRGRVSTSSTQKQFDLGEDVDPTTIRASVSDSGRLTIVAFGRQ